MEVAKKETAAAKKKRLAAEAKSETKTEVKPEVKPAAKAKVEAEAKPAAKVDDWKGRVRTERSDLFDKIKALSAFLDSDASANIAELDRTDLLQQLDAMNLYRRALDTRIAKFV